LTELPVNGREGISKERADAKDEGKCLILKV
jgi:hypothetical protein